MKRFLMLSVLMLILLLTASLNSIYAVSQKSSDLPKDHPDTTPQQIMPDLSGKVVETMDSSGYTYVNIEKDGKKTWVAVLKMKVKVGQDMSFQPGMVMKNFTSKSLDRTFESIVFSAGPVGQKGMQSAYSPAGHGQSKAAVNKTIKVEKASGTDAYIVAELYEKSFELNGQNVVFRGQVVKFSSKIMDKNWIHIQDGSGNTVKGNHDILVTSKDTISVGDIITVKGTLYKDKDFGSGYKYAVIVEAESIKK